jgi:ribosomal protein S18 acetylase RimI-like enzyme
METRITKDKKEIYSFLSKTPDLQLYAIGDLDDFFWPYTTWFALYDKGDIQSMALLYSGNNPPTLLLFHDSEPDYPTALLKSIRDLLPEKLNVHLSPGLKDHFGRENIIKVYGYNHRMILTGEPKKVAAENIRQLTKSDIPIIEDLLKIAYPGNWFNSRMVDTGKYFGYFDSGMLTGIAGVHVYSPEYHIAALGNITTHPHFRGRKIAYNLTSFLCLDLMKSAEIIGLNVKSDNMAAIKCYQNVGFTIRGSFDDCFVRNVPLS